MNAKKPAKYECCIIEKVAAYFQPEKFSTARLMKTAAKAVPEGKDGKYIILQISQKNKTQTNMDLNI